MLTKAFLAVARWQKPAEFPISVLRREVLNQAPEGQTVTGKSKAGDAEFTFDNRSDGKTFSLKIGFRCEGKEYKSEVVAEETATGSYEIKSLVLNNQAEKLKNFKENLAILDMLGDMVYHIDRFKKAPPLQDPNSGVLNPVSRFAIRWMPAYFDSKTNSLCRM